MTNPCLRLLASALLPLALAGGCASLGSDLPDEPPPLLSMEEPPALFAEPDDEAARLELPLGGWTGLHVTDGRTIGGIAALAVVVVAATAAALALSPGTGESGGIPETRDDATLHSRDTSPPARNRLLLFGPLPVERCVVVFNGDSPAKIQ